MLQGISTSTAYGIRVSFRHTKPSNNILVDKIVNLKSHFIMIEYETIQLKPQNSFYFSVSWPVQMFIVYLCLTIHSVQKPFL